MAKTQAAALAAYQADGSPLSPAERQRRYRERKRLGTPLVRPTVEERFWRLVLKTDGCWLWTGTRERGGYGMFWDGSRQILAHRFAYELLIGPLGDLHALHHCDNPPCVRPDHLWSGTPADNAADRDAKGRGRLPPDSSRRPLSGERHPAHKLSSGQVVEIRKLRAAGHKQQTVADAFGVSVSAIKDIDAGRSWRQ
jgi:hypothetical protein